MDKSSQKFYKENKEFLQLLTKFVGDNYNLRKENENLKNKLIVLIIILKTDFLIKIYYRI